MARSCSSQIGSGAWQKAGARDASSCCWGYRDMAFDGGGGSNEEGDDDSYSDNS